MSSSSSSFSIASFVLSPCYPFDVSLTNIVDIHIGPSLDAAIVETQELVQFGRAFVKKRWTRYAIVNIDNHAEEQQISKEEKACDEKYEQDKKKFMKRYVQCDDPYGRADAHMFTDRLNVLKNRLFMLQMKRNADIYKIEGESDEQATQREKKCARDQIKEYEDDGMDGIDQEQLDAAHSVAQTISNQ